MAPITPLHVHQLVQRNRPLFLAGIDSFDHVHIILGTNSLAAARCESSLAVGAKPIVIAHEQASIHRTLQAQIDAGNVLLKTKAFEYNDLLRLGRQQVGGVVDAVFVTTQLHNEEIEHISHLCKQDRIPINVVDAPHLSTFTILSTHTDGPLQIGVTTNNRRCKLASRITREIASTLPRGLGNTCDRLRNTVDRLHNVHDAEIVSPRDLDNSLGQGSRFNQMAVCKSDDRDTPSRRLRWLAQVSEYWPLQRLASLTDADIEDLLSSCSGTQLEANWSNTVVKGLGRIILAGSGPGHPDLLTRATYKAMRVADLVLADKLVPSSILELIPCHIPIQIARKFPGNANAAQQEMQETCIAEAYAGKTVLRLKQGDPFLYGRGGEEVDCFRRAGLGGRITVLPGITSALSAPLLAGIPTTQRGVADQVLVCTGTGKNGTFPVPPGFVPSRTVIFLMALHRIDELVKELITRGCKLDTARRLWPVSTPCAVIERASCPDQRVIRTTLEHVGAAVEKEGSRPPGLLVVGSTCESLCVGESDVKWTVEEGFDAMHCNSDSI